MSPLFNHLIEILNLDMSSITIKFHDFNLSGNISQENTFRSDCTWLHICETFLSQDTSTQDSTWTTWVKRKGDQDYRFLIIGIDIPLTSKLAEWDMQYKLIYVHTAYHTIPYESIKYAVSAARAHLTWPLWNAEETDLFNSDVMGCYEGRRKQAGPTLIPEENNNKLDNLIGFTNATGIIKCCNRYQFTKYLKIRGDQEMQIVDPFFNQVIIIHQWQSLVSKILKENRLLPIWSHVTNTFVFPYDAAMTLFQAWIEITPGEAKRKTDEIRRKEKFYINLHTSDAYIVINNGGSLRVAFAKLKKIHDPIIREDKQILIKAHYAERHIAKRRIAKKKNRTIIDLT